MAVNLKRMEWQRTDCVNRDDSSNSAAMVPCVAALITETATFEVWPTLFVDALPTASHFHFSAVVAVFSPPVDNILALVAVILTLALVIILAAEVLQASGFSSGRTYFVLLPLALAVLVMLGLSRPFPSRWELFLKWLGVVLPVVLLISLAFNYVKERGKIQTLKPKASRSRIIVATLVVACLIFFVGGILGVWAGWLTSERYVVITGVLGGVASVVGLISLARPSLKQDDLAMLELGSLKQIAENSEEIKRLEMARATAQQEIGNLEAQKRQMQLLVEKGSLSLFLQEQRRTHEKRIRDELSRNETLAGSLEQLGAIDQKLTALQEEISKDPNVELLQRVIEAAKQKPEERPFSEYPPLTRALLTLARHVTQMFLRLR